MWIYGSAFWGPSWACSSVLVLKLLDLTSIIIVNFLGDLLSFWAL
jgi:hypothetical protein